MNWSFLRRVASSRSTWDGTGGERMDLGAWVVGTCRGVWHPVRSKSSPLGRHREGQLWAIPYPWRFSLWVKWLWFSFFIGLTVQSFWLKQLSWEGKPKSPQETGHFSSGPQIWRLFLPAETLNGPSWAQHTVCGSVVSHHREGLPFRTWLSVSLSIRFKKINKGISCSL